MNINLNGAIVPASENHVHHSNRGFRYGDGVFESMAMFDGKVKLIALHASRIATGAQILELNLPSALHEKKITLEVEKLREANNLTNGRIRIVLTRKIGGYYAPISNDVDYIIESEVIANNQYELNVEGLRIGCYKEIVKPVNILSSIKTCNALIYVKAGLYKNKTSLDECIILNQYGNLCESISHNLFWVKNKVVFTPSADSGCVLGVMRNYLLQWFSEINIECHEGEYTIDAILNADEVFLSGATKGIQWIAQLTEKDRIIKFGNSFTKEIFEKALR